MSNEINSENYKPISPWGYFGYNLLFAIPLIGWLCWLVCCFSENVNVKNYARSLLIPLVIALILFGIIFLSGFMIYYL